MLRGPLAQESYRPQFSGHETFPLRYGWLKKAFDAVVATSLHGENKQVFLGEDSIARFGVGKNMVAAMRHWATAASVIGEMLPAGRIPVTSLGQKLFADVGLDPFMEHPATLWLIHWQLAAHPSKTTWFWAFNHYGSLTFERDQLLRALERLAKEQNWSRVSTSTIKNDVACFVRTYVPHDVSGLASNDDALESPLTELGIIKSIGKRDGFRFVRGPKSTLGNGVFVYALIDFWLGFSKSTTLSFEAIAHEPGSPGRVFLLDENDVIDRLVDLETITQGVLRWSETAGLKQVVRTKDIDIGLGLSFVDADYASQQLEEDYS
jgi:hypothetical protein